MLFVQILVVSLIWLVAFFAIAAPIAGYVGHGGELVLAVALVFGACGVVAEVAYLIIERTLGRTRSPRWFVVAWWTLVAAFTVMTAWGIASLRADQLARFFSEIIVLLIVSILPVFVVAYLASWPFRARRSKRVTTSKLKDYYEGKDYYGIWD